MRKVLFSTLIAAALPQAHAMPLVDFYAGVNSWNQSFSGDISDSNTSVDLDSDLNLESARQNGFYLAFEHPIPALPNIRLEFTTLTAEGDDGQVPEAFELDGDSFSTDADDIETEVDFSHDDITLYWSLPLPMVSVDLGVTGRRFDGYVKMSSESEGEEAEADFSALVPMLYGNVGVDILFTGFSVGAGFNYLGLGSSAILDYDLNATYVLPIIPVLDIGVTAGYRSFDFDIDPEDFGGDEDDVTAKAQVAGPYLGLSIHL